MTESVSLGMDPCPVIRSNRAPGDLSVLFKIHVRETSTSIKDPPALVIFSPEEVCQIRDPVVPGDGRFRAVLVSEFKNILTQHGSWTLLA